MEPPTKPHAGSNKSLADLHQVLDRHRPNLTPWVDLYKDIHQHPELSGNLERTAKVVIDQLNELGLHVKAIPSDIGVAALLENGPGKTLLLRAELDAFAVGEETGLDYASTILRLDGRNMPCKTMHACGHDVHIACLLASLSVLKSAREEWSGTVIAIFQPGEIAWVSGQFEFARISGAQLMLKYGLYDFIPRPDIMLAQHVDFSKAGHVAVRAGLVLPASDFISIYIQSHGPDANPSACPNLISSAGKLLVQYQEIIEKDIGHDNFAQLTYREFHATECEAKYIYEAYIRLEIKTTNIEIRDKIIAAVKTITEAECSMHEGKLKARINTSSQAPLTENDEVLAKKLQHCFEDYFGDRFWIPAMDTDVEDFSLLSGSTPVPYVYWTLGATDPEVYDEAVKKGGNLLEHLPVRLSPRFAPNPQLTIRTGTDAMALASLFFLNDN